MPRNDFRDAPTTNGAPACAATRGKGAQQREVVRERLAEADAGVDEDPVTGDAGRDRGVDPRTEILADLAHDVRVDRVVLHRPRRALHVHRHETGSVLGDRRQHRRIGGAAPRRR